MKSSRVTENIHLACRSTLETHRLNVFIEPSEDRLFVQVNGNHIQQHVPVAMKSEDSLN